MKRSSLLALSLALALGAFWYFYDFKGGAQRSQAASDAKLVFPDLKQFQPEELELRNGGDKELFLKKDGDTWHIVKPVAAEVDKNAMSQVLDGLQRLSNEGTVAEKDADLREFGLDKPSGAVTYKPLSGASQALFFGNDNPSQQYSYSMIDGKPAVFMVQRFGKSGILKSLNDLRDKQIWDFEVGQAMNISSSFGKGLKLSRDKSGAWMLGKQQCQDGNVMLWLTQLKGLRMGEVADETAKTPTNFGIGLGQRLEIQIAEKPESLILYQGYRSQTTIPGHYYQLKGRPLIFSIPDSSTKFLTKSSADFLSATANVASNPGLSVPPQAPLPNLAVMSKSKEPAKSK